MQYQGCFFFPADSPVDESCRLISDNTGGSEEYSLWTCICGVTGCNNVSVISSLDAIRANVNRSSAEAQPTSTVSVNYSTTEIDGYPLPVTALQYRVTTNLQEQAFHYGLCKCSGREWEGERGRGGKREHCNTETFPKFSPPLHYLYKQIY